LNRLSPRIVREMIAQVAAQNALADETLGPIKKKVEKSHRIFSKSLFYNPKLEFGASQKSGL
jgi:hypothetical protein